MTADATSAGGIYIYIYIYIYMAPHLKLVNKKKKDLILIYMDLSDGDSNGAANLVSINVKEEIPYTPIHKKGR